VVKTLAELMQSAGKQVVIGDGSATASGFNYIGGISYRTFREDVLVPMQELVYRTTGYTDMAAQIGVPLANFWSEDTIDVPVQPSAYVFPTIKLPTSVTDADLVCSVPIMKTHTYSTVTLGMKNLFGLYASTAYGSVRGFVHDEAKKKNIDPTATNIAIMDMLNALRGQNKLGLTIVDATQAMEGNGPANGTRKTMNLIIAGTDILAVDRIASYVMGFEQSEVQTLGWADEIGLRPATIEEIEIRGVCPSDVRSSFVRPTVYPYTSWGPLLPGG
jgi:uncharacterized protein (DUF362 family)